MKKLRHIHTTAQVRALLTLKSHSFWLTKTVSVCKEAACLLSSRGVKVLPGTLFCGPHPKPLPPLARGKLLPNTKKLARK